MAKKKDVEAPQKSLSEQLESVLWKAFPDGNWRKDITLSVRADNLYWLVHLAETGLQYKRILFKSGTSMDAASAASLGSWQLDLEQLLEKIKTALDVK